MDDKLNNAINKAIEDGETGGKRRPSDVVLPGLAFNEYARRRMDAGIVHPFVIPTTRQLKNMRRKR